MGIDRTAVNQVLGTAMMLGGNLQLGALMSPNQDVLIEMPGYQIDKDIWLCQSCAMGPYAISPLELMMAAEDEA